MQACQGTIFRFSGRFCSVVSESSAVSLPTFSNGIIWPAAADLAAFSPAFQRALVASQASRNAAFCSGVLWLMDRFFDICTSCNFTSLMTKRTAPVPMLGCAYLVKCLRSVLIASAVLAPWKRRMSIKKAQSPQDSTMTMGSRLPLRHMPRECLR